MKKREGSFAKIVIFWHLLYHGLLFWLLRNIIIKITIQGLLAQRWQVGFTLPTPVGLVVTSHNALLRRIQNQLPNLVENFQ